MKCKNCNKEDAVKYTKWSSGEFCSKRCACSFSTKLKRKEINEKVSKKLSEKFSGCLSPLKGRKKSPEEIEKQSKSLTEFYIKRKEKLKKEIPFELWPKNWKEKFLYNETGNRCECCGYEYTDANTGKGPFEIHHKDGNNDNWKRENLEILCLNCHWKTNNWRFRGKHHSEEAVEKMRIVAINNWKNGVINGKIKVKTT